jgi:uncharacterized protein
MGHDPFTAKSSICEVFGVRFRLRPVETRFFELFLALAQQLVLGAELLGEALEDDVDIVELSGRMREAEHAADDTTHEIIQLVNRSFITPFDREDIYVLANTLDDVIDNMDDAIDSMALFRVESFPAGFADQVAVLQRATHLTLEAMRRLRSMRNLDEYWIEINRLENNADQFHRVVLAELFSGNYKALQVLKIKDIVDSVERSMNSLESAANAIEQIAVKES